MKEALEIITTAADEAAINLSDAEADLARHDKKRELLVDAVGFHTDRVASLTRSGDLLRKQRIIDSLTPDGAVPAGAELKP